MIRMVWKDGNETTADACTMGTRYVPGCILYPTSVLPCPLPQSEVPYLMLDETSAYRWSVLRRVVDEAHIAIAARRVRDDAGS